MQRLFVLRDLLVGILTAWCVTYRWWIALPKRGNVATVLGPTRWSAIVREDGSSGPAVSLLRDFEGQTVLVLSTKTCPGLFSDCVLMWPLEIVLFPLFVTLPDGTHFMLAEVVFCTPEGKFTAHLWCPDSPFKILS